MNSTHAILAAGVLAVGLASCNRAPNAAAGGTAAIAQLTPVATNDIAKTPALLTVAMDAGKTLYETHCSSCHGADLKGIADKHTPDLTDNEWIYVGDDLDTGGAVHTAADVEKTILLGIRAIPRVTNLGSQQENDAKNLPNKNLADMPAMAMGPDSLTDAEITDAAEYVLRLGGQDHDAAMAERGKVLFEGDEAGCYDCHEPEGTGDEAIGSTNLTKPSLYLYGSTREAILASIKGGRAGVSPAFQGKLKPEEVKAIAVYVFSKSGPGSLPPAP
jgi:cytochrome c oxidase cbb3-type subunit 3